MYEINLEIKVNTVRLYERSNGNTVRRQIPFPFKEVVG